MEGGAGGGLSPWALLAGYGTREGWGAAASYTYVSLNDYRLNSAGAALSILDRLEVSFAHQALQFTGRVLPGSTVKLQVFGAKLRVWGDAVYDQDRWLPQISIGVQHKRNLDFDAIPRALGARRAYGTDAYMAASKLILAPPGGRSLLLNAAVRASEANQLGLLGFGGDRRNRYRALGETSAALFLDERTAVGVEFRQKPDNLSSFKEDPWGDAFIAFFPSKSLGLVAAYAKLGKIAGREQSGLYLSVQASY